MEFFLRVTTFCYLINPQPTDTGRRSRGGVTGTTRKHMLGVELQIPRVIYISWQTNDSESDSGERDMNHFDVGVETRKRKPGERIKKQIV